MKGNCMAKNVTVTEYMCTHCGRKERRAIGLGRPDPGTCPRRTNNQPHRWVVNRKL